MRKKPRKKICKKCGRKLWLRDFYQTKQGWRAPYCKECSREIKRAEYARNRKKADGLYLDRETGRLMEHDGRRTCIHLSDPMKEKLRRIFATTKNEDCAIELGVSPRTVIRWARSLGLEKNASWLAAHARKNCETMRILNKCRGNAGMIKPGERKSPATEFKKRK